MYWEDIDSYENLKRMEVEGAGSKTDLVSLCEDKSVLSGPRAGYAALKRAPWMVQVNSERCRENKSTASTVMESKST